VQGAQPFIHPGTFGTAPRLLRTFVFDKKVITLPFAIRALTSLPAQILGPARPRAARRGPAGRRGGVRPEDVARQGHLLRAVAVQQGISTVIVNGRFVVDGGKPTDAKPGRVLERQRS
jgi:N-acyl-D-amino-acid deacylase